MTITFVLLPVYPMPTGFKTDQFKLTPFLGVFQIITRNKCVCYRANKPTQIYD